MDWSSLLTFAVIGLMFFLMMRHGGGCCGSMDSRPQGDAKDSPEKKEDAQGRDKP